MKGHDARIRLPGHGDLGLGGVDAHLAQPVLVRTNLFDRRRLGRGVDLTGRHGLFDHCSPERSNRKGQAGDSVHRHHSLGLSSGPGRFILEHVDQSFND
jgi:hypothetical protein